MAVILPGITLSYLTVVTFLVAITVIFQPADFSHLKSRKGEGSHQSFLNGNCCAGGSLSSAWLRPALQPQLWTLLLTLFPAAQRTMGYAAPGAVVAVVLSSSFLIKSIYHRHGEQRPSSDCPNAPACVVPTALQFLLHLQNQTHQPGSFREVKCGQEQNSVSTPSTYFISYFLCVCTFMVATCLPPPLPALLSLVAEEGCTEFMNVTLLVATTAAVAALPLLAIGLCCESAPSSSSSGSPHHPAATGKISKWFIQLLLSPCGQ